MTKEKGQIIAQLRVSANGMVEAWVVAGPVNSGNVKKA